jgi:hypothetical protein
MDKAKSSFLEVRKNSVRKKDTNQGIEKEEKEMDPAMACARAALMRCPNSVSDDEEQRLRRLDPRRNH